MSRSSILILFFALVFSLSSCTNQFAYKPSEWKQVSESESKEKSEYTAAYIDKNRTDCKDGECQAWTKMVFGEVRSISYSGSKPGQVSGEMQAKRIDSSVKFDCKRRLMTLISYQIYDGSDKMIDSKWVQSEPEFVSPHTLNYDLMKNVCGDLEE